MVVDDPDNEDNVDYYSLTMVQVETLHQLEGSLRLPELLKVTKQSSRTIRGHNLLAAVAVDQQTTSFKAS
jgi:hypothetical protein